MLAGYILSAGLLVMVYYIVVRPISGHELFQFIFIFLILIYLFTFGLHTNQVYEKEIQTLKQRIERFENAG